MPDARRALNQSNLEKNFDENCYDDQNRSENDEICINHKMILDEKGYIYYLTMQKGLIKIKEINPV